MKHRTARTVHTARTVRAAGLVLPALLAILAGGCGRQGDRRAGGMEVLAGGWQLVGFENELDLSGIAAATASQCLVGSDESFHVQPGVIDAAQRRIEAGQPIALPLEVVPGKPGKREVDIEGVVFAPERGSYYVVGSHGVGKKKGDLQPARHSVFQVPVDPCTGLVDQSRIRRSSLSPWLEATPAVAAHLHRPLQHNGLNIEGLAHAGGRLFFGLRAPNKRGRALVLELPADELFGGQPRPLAVHQVKVGAGRGIRELAAVRGGFVVLTGNASAEPSKKIPRSAAPGPDTRFELLLWNGRDPAATRLGVLPATGGKAEGLLVLDDAAQHVDLLVLFDSLPGGAPVCVRCRR